MKKHSTIRFNLFLFTLLTIFGGCIKEVVREFPRIRTLPCEVVSNGVIFKGEIANFGDMELDEYGFAFIEGERNQLSEFNFISVGSELGSSTFEYKLTTGLESGKVYSYFAWASSNNILNMGSDFVFLGGGSDPPEIIRFEPTTGFVGDSVTIICRNIVGKAENYTVLFSERSSPAIIENDSTLKTRVPLNLTNTESTVSVSAYGKIASFPGKFTLLTPEILTFYPSEVNPGDTVYITGNNFPENKNILDVRFNNNHGSVVSSGAGLIKVIAPNPADSMNYIRVVTLSGQSDISDTQIKIRILPEPFEQVADFPGGESYKSGAFSIGGFGYVGMGTKSGHVLVPGFWKYDPANNSWSDVASFPGAGRISPQTFSIGEIGYCGGGYDIDAPWRKALSDFYSYNPEDNSWTVVDDYTGALDDHFSGISEAVDATAYIIFTPVDFYSYTKDADPKWSPLAPPTSTQVPYSNSFVLGNEIFMIGGQSYPEGVYSSQVWKYNVSLASWERMADFPGGARALGVSFVIENEAYYGFGYNGSKFFNDLWKYDYSQDSWAKVADIDMNARACSFFFTVGDNAFIGGGFGSGGVFYKDMYIIRPGSFK